VGIQEVITEIEPAHILILNTINSTVESNCTTNISIKGSALITFENCEVYINRIPYDKELLQFEEKIEATIPVIQNINFTNHIEDIHLHNLKLRSINASNSIIYWKKFTTTNFGAVYLLLLVGVLASILWINTKKKIVFASIPEPSFVTSSFVLAVTSIQEGRSYRPVGRQRTSSQTSQSYPGKSTLTGRPLEPTHLDASMLQSETLFRTGNDPLESLPRSLFDDIATGCPDPSPEEI